MDMQLITSYAELVIRKGINLQKNKGVVILTGPGTYYFARALSKAAYRNGASYVHVMLDDLDVLSSRLDHQSDEQLKFNPAFIKALDYEFCAEGWSYIRIDNTEDRLDHAPLDAHKNQILGKAKKEFSQARINTLMRHQLAWCVCCAPGPRWAKQVLGEAATEDQLLEVLRPILLLDQEDPCKAWDEKHLMLKKRQEYLNSLHIDTLHFRSSVTDLTIGFTQKARFEGGSAQLTEQTAFFPNLPTEEIFTTPDRMRCDGYVTTTKPVSVQEMTTEEVQLVFSKGEVVDYSAKKGKEALDLYFSVDEGTKRLGEVALVDQSSPIAKSGLIFNSILFDENASCHIALGDGYPSCLVGGGSLQTEEALHNAGCNTSLMHTDFMIGSPDMQIYARTIDGREIVIMKDGEFVF